MEIESGSLIGGYRIIRPLGRGAMGAVYEAAHKSLPMTVALKVMNPGFAAHQEVRARFDREADLLCALHHPNIVDALDKGQDGEHLFLAMRFIDGRDLDAVLRERGPFPPERAVEVVATIGRALDHAHSRGLLHRDVKPANIMLRRGDGGAEEAVLTDFGIATSAGATALTTEAGPPATVPYTAPERLKLEPVDGRADVYSLGAVLFELLTGARAFPMDMTEALYAAVLFGPVPDPRAVRPDLPPALAAVVVRALQKEPAARFATCAELTVAAHAALAPGAAAHPGPGAAAPPTTVGVAPVPPPLPPSVTALSSPPPGAAPGARVATARDPRPGPPPQLAEPPRRASRWVPVAVALAAAVLLAVAVVVVVLTTGGGDGDDAAADGTPGTSTGSSPGTASSAAEEAQESTAPTAAQLAVGDCLDAGGNPTTCDGEHAVEVYSTTGCSLQAALDYLGGQAGIDVLRQDVDLLTAGPACTVGLPGTTLDGRVAGVLDGRADEWRRCTDDGAPRPCSEPHTAEVVFEQQAATDPLNCTTRAGDYMGGPFSRHDDALAVRPEGATCVVEVRGDNVLTASLRELNSGALPLEAA